MVAHVWSLGIELSEQRLYTLREFSGKSFDTVHDLQ